jgi:hypothetical protein
LATRASWSTLYASLYFSIYFSKEVCYDNLFCKWNISFLKSWQRKIILWLWH